MPRQPPQLLEKIAAGDAAAFSAFYEAWFGAVLAWARHASRGDEHGAEDLVQEVFMRVIRATPRLDEPASIAAWLRRAVLNAAIDRARAQSRRGARERLVAHREPAPRDDADRLGLVWLQSQLADLDAQSRELLIERYAFGRTLAQVGAALGLSPGAVDGRIGRVLAALRRRANRGDHHD